MALLRTVLFLSLSVSKSNADPIAGNLCSYCEVEVKALVNFIISEHNVHSHSIRFLTKKTNGVVDHWLQYLGESYPLISGSVSSITVGKPVILVFLLEPSTTTNYKDHENYVLDWITASSNTRLDYFTFIGQESIILKLWKVRKINRLRYRWAYASDSKKFMSRSEGKPNEASYFAQVDNFPPVQSEIGSNIRGRHIKLAGWAHVPPYLFIHGKDNIGNDVYDGSHLRLFHEASLLFNFTYELYSDEKAASYGQLLEDGNWTGQIGAVHSGAYDACVYIGPNLVWYPMFDFAGSLSGAGISFLTPKPKTELKWQAFLYPFRVTLWVALLILFLVVLILMLGLMKFAELKILPTTGSFQIVAATTLTFQIALEQSTRVPSGVRTICGAWLLFSIIIGTAYKSQVMSSLTFPFTEKLPSSYQELALHKEYTSVLNNLGGLEVQYFQSNDSQLITLIAKTLSYEPVPIKCIEKAVLYHKTVCIGWFPFLEYTAAEWASPDAQVNPIYISDDSVMPVIVSIGFKKYSPLTQGFTPIITSFWESGIYKVWENNVLHIHKHKGVVNYRANPSAALQKQLKSIVDSITGGNGEKPLKVSNLKVMFVVLAIGACLGASAFTFEQMLNWILQRITSVKPIKLIVVLPQ